MKKFIQLILIVFPSMLWAQFESPSRIYFSQKNSSKFQYMPINKICQVKLIKQLPLGLSPSKSIDSAGLVYTFKLINQIGDTLVFEPNLRIPFNNLEYLMFRDQLSTIRLVTGLIHLSTGGLIFTYYKGTWGTFFTIILTSIGSIKLALVNHVMINSADWILEKQNVQGLKPYRAKKVEENKSKSLFERYPSN